MDSNFQFKGIRGSRVDLQKQEKKMLGLGTAIGVLALMTAAQGQSVFNDAERQQVVTFWNKPARYSIALPETSKTTPWQVRLTPEGSQWLLRYQQAMGSASAPPTQDAIAATSGTQGWREWVQAKIAWDRWQAQQTANSLNASGSNAPSSRFPAPSDSAVSGNLDSATVKRSAQADNATPPPFPGIIPDSLLKAAGNAPLFASPVLPRQYTIQFDEGDSYSYSDNTKVSPSFAYYRFPQGVATGGVPLADAERSALFGKAGLSDTQQRVMLSVSRLEGSFDSINTYDTGFVSVGFIQFITGEDGRQSLVSVLNREKMDSAPDFERDFRRFGIDLTPEGTLSVIDPSTGAELRGKDAVYRLIEDKRLIAVFQKAGRTSPAFRVAQIQIAKSQYWPADDALNVTVGTQVLTGRVSDVIKSEAGMATFFDRKVNRGSVNPLPAVLGRIVQKYSLTSLADAALFEREIVAACKYRVDFLQDSSLSQPR